MKYRIILTILLGLICFTYSLSAQELNAYYKSEKSYIDAKINGLKSQEKDGKYGFVNTKGKFVIKPIFEKVYEFTNELAIIKYNGKWGLIDLHGNTIIEPEYTNSPLKLTYKVTEDTDIIQCRIFKAKDNTNSVAVLYYKDGRYYVIDIKKHIREHLYDFLVTEMSDESLRAKGIAYGYTFMIRNDGVISIADAMSSVVDGNNIAVKQGNKWGVINVEFDDGGGLPNGTEIFDVKKVGFIFKQNATETYSYVYHDNHTKNFILMESIQTAPQEKLFGNLTCIRFRDGNWEEYYLILDKLNHEIANDIYSYKTIENNQIKGLIELTHKGGSKSIVNENGIFITDGSTSFHKIKGKYIIVSQRHHGDTQTDDIVGYGIIDSQGNMLVPPVLKEDDIIIENDSYLICAKHCANRNIIFASSDGWYKEINKNDKIGLGEALSEFALKSTSSSNNIAPMKFMFSPSYKICRQYLNTHWRGMKWFREETFDGITYTQPVLGIFHDRKNVYPTSLKTINNELFGMNATTGEFVSVGPYDTYIIYRENENGTPYLKIRNSEFNLYKLARILYGEKGEMSLTSISPSEAQDVIDAVYGGSGKMAPKRIGELSNGKMLLKLESQGVVNPNTYIASTTWYSLGKSTQKHMENVAQQIAATRERTVQSNLILFDIENSEIDKILVLDSHFDPKYEEDYAILIGRDGFYLSNSIYLARFNNDGELIWEFGGDTANYLLGFDENDSQVIITGYNTAEKYYNKANPMTVLINKETGDIISREVESYMVEGKVNHYWERVVFIENGYILQREDPEATNENKYITKIVKL